MLFSGQPETVQVARGLSRFAVLTVLAVATAAVEVAAGPYVPTIRLLELPPEARTTHQLVQSGGPFPYIKDGTVFANRERSLPTQARGFYREYTVVTPASRDRGARRLVCGGYQTSKPDVCYYSGDHYSSFRKIVK